jgi:hypothetical protein
MPCDRHFFNVFLKPFMQSFNLQGLLPSFGCLTLLVLWDSSSAANAQNRTIGVNKLVLDDGQGHSITIQTPVDYDTNTSTGNDRQFLTWWRLPGTAHDEPFNVVLFAK